MNHYPFNNHAGSLRLLVAMVVALVMGTLTANAQSVTANFNSGLPDGWSLVGDVTNADDRARSGKGLFSYSKSSTDNYVVTSTVEGTFSFYARAYNKSADSYVVVYKYTGSGLGEQVYTTGSMRTSYTPTWSQYSFVLSEPTQLAIVLNYAAIDDATYTPYVVADVAELAVTDYASGSSYDFGGSPVPAGTTKSFTLRNKGAKTLNISSIAVSGGYTISEGAALTQIAAESQATVTVSTPAADATGALTIVSDDANSPYTINLSSTYKVPAPVMSLDMTTVKFGTVSANASQTITVSNTGDAALTATIASDNADFTVAPASLNVAAGATGTFTITYVYDAKAYGTHSATITVTPNAGEAQQVSVSAKVQNPRQWNEDFSGNALPSGWTADASWSFTDGVAKAVYGSYSTGYKHYLTTPTLEVDGTADELTFHYRATASNVAIKIQASKDGGEFTDLETISGLNSMTEFQEHTISGLAAGNYKLRFANDDYELDDFDGFLLSTDAPEMTLQPIEDAVFGKVTATPAAKTYTVSNTGTGRLTVNITSTSSDFTVTPAQLVNIVPGEPKTFTVTFNYDIDNLGDHAATITVTPTYNTTMARSFNATATSKDPNLWTEDFEEGIPATWVNEAGAWTTTHYGHAGQAGPLSNQTATLTTPRLQATKDQQLQFDVIDAESDTYFLQAEYSTDRTSWTVIEKYTDSGTKQFTAPADGYYWLRFTGNYTYVDNFSGFKEAPLEHDATIASQSIPATGTQLVEYTATVTVREMAGKSETLTARFFIGSTQMGDDVTETIDANGTTTFTVTFTPDEAVTGDAYFTVSNADISLSSAKQAVTINAATIWKDTEVNTIEATTYDALIIQYTKAKGWNSVCLPLQTSISAFGEDVKAFSLSSYDGTTLHFSQVTTGTLNAATPYLLYSESAGMVNLSYINKTIYDAFIGSENIRQTTGGATFQGTYEPVSDGSLAGKYGVVPSTGKIVKADNTITIKGFRAWLELPAGAPAPGVDIDAAATGISAIDNGQWSMDNGQWYDLQGRKIANSKASNSKLPKGLYIVNGKKVIVK